MNNKYVMGKALNKKYIRQHITAFLRNNMLLARYVKNDEEFDSLMLGGHDNEAYTAFLNFGKAYEYILNSEDPIDYDMLLKLHIILMENVYDGINNGLTSAQINELSAMINQPAKANTEIAIDVMLYILEKRLFADGDVRTALMFANKIMCDHGCGIITVFPEYIDEFREKLKGFKSEEDNGQFKEWLYRACVRGIKNYDY